MSIVIALEESPSAGPLYIVEQTTGEALTSKATTYSSSEFPVR